ncbi:MAG: hypothetical protein DMF69_19785 [Acidobacteria bacterium]|nr:MAG: hypothetical protein DMF69_19785 [Acidobacteriota bacterium]
MLDQLDILEQNGIDKAEVRFQLAVDYAKTLEIVQRVIAGVEKVILSSIPQKYAVDPALSVARNLKQAIKEKETERIAEAEDHLSNELYLWHLSLTTRDQKIQPYHLRRFCDGTYLHLDPPSFQALTRFYRSLPHSESVQSKYDFSVTRLFSRIGENDQRKLRLGGDRLIESLSKMADLWRGDRSLPSATPEQIAGAVDGLRAFIAEANTSIDEFEELISSDLSNRIRLFKRDLGELFYEPRVTAAAVECNVALANKFSTLLIGEGEQIREAPDVCRDLVNLLVDRSINPSTSERFDETELAKLEEQAPSSERLSRLLRLTSSGVDQTSALREESGLPADLPLTLSKLAEDHENKEIISEFLRTPLSVERQFLDPVSFLAPFAESLPGHPEEREVRRNSLSLILSSERLLRSKLGNDNQLDDLTEAELAEVMLKMQQTDSVLRVLISAARSGSQSSAVDQLLHISNHLLQARLKLQSVLVQRAADLTREKLSSEEIKVQEPAPKRTFSSLRKSKALAIAAVVIIMVCAGVVFKAFNDRSDAATSLRDKEVQMLNVKDLPGSEMLVNARTRRDLLVGVVSKKWKIATEGEREEELKALLRFGKPIGVSTVLLVDNSGDQMGSASDSHLTLH